MASKIGAAVSVLETSPGGQRKTVGFQAGKCACKACKATYVHAELEWYNSYEVS